jgi:hypothetical protein
MEIRGKTWEKGMKNNTTGAGIDSPDGRAAGG